MSHTSAPWKLTTLKNNRGHIIRSKSGCLIAYVEQYPQDASLAPQCLPNAKLIQQAPKLLEALEELVKHLEFIFEDEYSKPLTPDILSAKELINKARGGVVSPFCECGTKSNELDVNGRCEKCGKKLQVRVKSL